MLLADPGYDADWIRALAALEGRLGQHPTKMQSQWPNLLQPVSLPCPQLDRAVLQQSQTVSEGRYSLRQARGQLPRVRAACILWLRVNEYTA